MKTPSYKIYVVTAALLCLMMSYSEGYAQRMDKGIWTCNLEDSTNNIYKFYNYYGTGMGYDSCIFSEWEFENKTLKRLTYANTCFEPGNERQILFVGKSAAYKIVTLLNKKYLIIGLEKTLFIFQIINHKKGSHYQPDQTLYMKLLYADRPLLSDNKE